MSEEVKERILNALADSLEIPDAAYETARSRYLDLGDWLKDESRAKVAQYSPHVSSQGSFRLGTAVKPWKRDGYDLDLALNLREGITKADCTQEVLKKLVGVDLNAYRIERGISENIESKHRCWRIKYQDHLKFHMDAVPSIPQAELVRRSIKEQMIQAGNTAALAQEVAELTVAITDDRHRNYRQVADEWSVSNPEGYAKWFESRMRLAELLLESRVKMARVATVDDLPAYKWKTPLQRTIQILKRHRDVMFEQDSDGKPISIIISTLAAAAYRGEPDLLSALTHILAEMGNMINPLNPRVPNPVNPLENFADKWRTEEGRRLRLQSNFESWLIQAQSDFSTITSSMDQEFLRSQMVKKFGVDIEEKTLGMIFGSFPNIKTTPKSHDVTAPAKPWWKG